MDKYGNRNGSDENNLLPPPPYSPTVSSSSRQELNNTPYNPSCTTGDANPNEPQPTAPSLYPEIPSHTSYTYQPLPNNNNNNNNNNVNNNVPSPIVRTVFPMPTPQLHYHNNNNINMPYPNQSPHIPPPHSPINNNNPGSGFYQPNQGNSGYQSIAIPPRVPSQQHPLFFFHHHQHRPQHSSTQYYNSELEERRRSFPIGALLFIFGWFFPPLWILGACCCSASRNPYEVFWARLNLIMALLLLLSSVLYSMLAVVAGDWYIGLQWAFASKQEI